MKESKNNLLISSNQAGNTFIGLMIGLILGLGIALGVAYLINRHAPTERANVSAPQVPIVPKIMPDGSIGESRDINSPLRGRKSGDTNSTTSEVPNPNTLAQQTTSDSATIDKSQSAVDVVYWLQLGAYAEKSAAESQKGMLAMQGLQAKVSELQRDNNIVWRVRLGPFSTQQEIQDSKKKLEDAGISYTIIKASKS